MCGLLVALFSLQRGNFSCRDTHSFNRYQTRQLVANMGRMSGCRVFMIFRVETFACCSPLHECPNPHSLGNVARDVRERRLILLKASSTI